MAAILEAFHSRRTRLRRGVGALSLGATAILERRVEAQPQSRTRAARTLSSRARRFHPAHEPLADSSARNFPLGARRSLCMEGTLEVERYSRADALRHTLPPAAGSYLLGPVTVQVEPAKREACDVARIQATII